MEQKNLVLALVLSMAILIGFQFLYADPEPVVTDADLTEQGLAPAPDGVPGNGVPGPANGVPQVVDQHIHRATVPTRPPGGGDRGADGLLLRRGEDIRDIEMARDRDIHSGRHIGLRIEIHDQRGNAAREGRRRQSERHGGLAYAPFEGADAQYVHEKGAYLQ